MGPDTPEPREIPPQHARSSSDTLSVRPREVPTPEAYRAAVDAAYRKHAIDEGCTRVREIEENVITPAMRRIESADPSRHLVGFDDRLKKEGRLTEKVVKAMAEQPDLTYQEAFATVKDAIRFTLAYPDHHYAEGLQADHERLESQGFRLVDRRNTWNGEQYKGVNTRWRTPESGQVFEVQFHTETSYKAKQETHSAYEKLRAPGITKAEQDRLADYQRRVTSRVPIPLGAMEIADYP